MLLKRWWHKRRRLPVPADSSGPRITFFGGKGGVGKTTCAAAYALGLADSGQRTLLISTDPAHSLGDLLQVKLGSKARGISERLDALELNPEKALKRYLNEVKNNLRQLASPELRDAAEHQADLAGLSPGATEAALFDEIVRLILDSDDYDALVFDTAPTGHTLHLLALPEIMGAWTDGLLARGRQSDIDWMQRAPEADERSQQAAAILQRRRDRFAAARTRLLDPGRTRFVPVLNPDALSREETARMLKTLGERGIPLDTLIINRVLPDSADGDFLARRRQAEAEHLAAIDRDFAHLKRLRIALTANEIRGLPALRHLACQLELLDTATCKPRGDTRP